MPTIYDIAKEAGVSPATVSKAFNDYTDVSDKTKKRILQIAKDLKYVPNLTARSLKTKKSYLVGVIFSEDIGIGLEHPYFSIVLENFRKAIGEYGYDTVFINNTLGERKIGYLDHCTYRNVDGVFILTAHESDSDVKNLFESDIKCVTTDVILKDKPYIMSDNVKGAKIAVEYLYENGHRRIAHISGPVDSISAYERYDGYKESLNKLKIEYKEEYYIESNLYAYDDAYEATLNLMKRFDVSERPTAIFVGADIMALGAIQALNTLGINVPEDISIIGFDDIKFAKYATPSITTIRQDKELIGRKVAETLYKFIHNENIEYNRLPVELVVRNSVKNINTD